MQRSGALQSKNKLEELLPLLDLRVSKEAVLSGGLFLARAPWHWHTDPAAVALSGSSVQPTSRVAFLPCIWQASKSNFYNVMNILRTSRLRILGENGNAKILEIKQVGTACRTSSWRPGSATLNQFVSIPNEQWRGKDMNCINKWMSKQTGVKAEAGIVAIQGLELHV